MDANISGHMCTTVAQSKVILVVCLTGPALQTVAAELKSTVKDVEKWFKIMSLAEMLGPPTLLKCVSPSTIHHCSGTTTLDQVLQQYMQGRAVIRAVNLYPYARLFET